MKFLKRLGLGVLASVLLLWGGLMAWAYWPVRAEVPVASLTTTEDRFVEVEGVRLRYREWGTATADRPAVLLIHGFGNSLQSFRELAPRLADCCHVIAIDMPGYGLSDKPVDFDYHNGPQAKVLIAAAKKIGLQRVIYVGHSLGGAVALQAAVLDPNARGLVLLNPGIIRTGVPKIVQITLPPLPRMSAKMFASRDFRGNFLKQSYVAGMTSLMKQYREGEEIALAPRVEVPTLIPWGDRDKNKPLSEADALQAMIPGSRLVHFANAGHYVHEEAAEGVAQAIKLWLPETVSGKTLVTP
jgi:pimeloyl-ACP methyl ester carboxylesterase